MAVHLTIDSHVVIQLGAELISDSEQALLELVKNSYDGDATLCSIVIEPEWMPDLDHPEHKKIIASASKDLPPGRIVVRDNGTGLSPDAVKNGWLLISASLKRPSTGVKSKTARMRTPVGDKGLGRLATMRLGNVLSLRTMVKGEQECRITSFAWTDFKAGAKLEDIQVKTAVADPLSGRRLHGTDVEILSLREPGYWDSDSNISSVLAKLSTLVTPFKKFKDFRVNIRYRDHIFNLESITAEALNYASAKFVISCSGEELVVKAYFARSLFRGQAGRAEREVYERLLAGDAASEAVSFFSTHRRIKARGFQALEERGSGWLFSLEERISFGDIPTDPRFVGAESPGPFEGELYYFLFNDQTKHHLQSAGIRVDMLQNMTTVGMFRDGFRVRMSDDWLELAKSATSGGYFQLRPRNVVGYFAISNEHNPGLVEKSDREGFVDTLQWRGFATLAHRAKKFANDALESVRSAYDEYKKAKLLSASEQEEIKGDPAKRMAQGHNDFSSSLENAQSASASLINTLDGVRASLETASQSLDPKSAQAVRRSFDAAARNVLALEDSLKKAESHAKTSMSAAEHLLLAGKEVESLNSKLIDAAAVGLSARALSHEIDGHLREIARQITLINSENRRFNSEKISEGTSKINGASREIRKVVSAIDPLLDTSRSLKGEFCVGAFLRDFFTVRASRLGQAGVGYKVVGGDGPKIRFAEARFRQIVENLYQNSLYWMTEGAVDSDMEKIMCVEITKDGFVWWDGGKGVREELADSIFEPYVTDKPASKGQGLGMFIATAYLLAERCSIYLERERNKFSRRYKFRVDLTGAMQK